MNASKTNHIDMIRYIGSVSSKLIEKLIAATVQPIGYTIEDDPSDQEHYIDRKSARINMTVAKISGRQLKNVSNPVIVYSNYRKLFNKTLEKIYKEQVSRAA